MPSLKWKRRVIINARENAGIKQKNAVLTNGK
jgi:hypothetical protein